MRNLSKFKGMGFGKLNLAEHVNFFTDFIALTAATDATVLHYEESDFTRLRELHNKEQDLVARSMANIETTEMQDLEKQRDDLGQYIIHTVRNGQSLPIATKAANAQRLWIVLKPYVGFYDQPHRQETATIDGMIMDLTKEENAPLVASLGLSEYVEELALVNARYRMLYTQRTAARDAAKSEDSKTLRAEMDALYDYITTVAFAHNVVTPSEGIEGYISLVNTTIDEINALYNQRMAQAKEEEEESV